MAGLKRLDYTSILQHGYSFNLQPRGVGLGVRLDLEDSFFFLYVELFDSQG